jgi:hypothetical protein
MVTVRVLTLLVITIFLGFIPVSSVFEHITDKFKSRKKIDKLRHRIRGKGSTGRKETEDVDINALESEIEENLDNVIEDPHPARINDTHPPSVLTFNTIDEPSKFSIISMVVDHHVDTKWYVPSFHERYSAGWNRSMSLGFLLRPYSCHIRFFGIGFETFKSNY